MVAPSLCPDQPLPAPPQVRGQPVAIHFPCAREFRERLQKLSAYLKVSQRTLIRLALEDYMEACEANLPWNRRKKKNGKTAGRDQE